VNNGALQIERATIRFVSEAAPRSPTSFRALRAKLQAMAIRIPSQRAAIKIK